MAISTVPAPAFRLPDDLMLAVANTFADTMATRRSVRDFSPEPVPLKVIEAAIRAAATAPSGANLQPWRFVIVIVIDPDRKRRLREAAEAEEREFYARRATPEWLKALEPLGTGWQKPFLEVAPALVVVFEVHRPRPYYVKESLGIAVGLLLATLHQAGLATLTHTPSPMKFLNEIGDRPREERAYAVIPVGYPAEVARVPDISRKPLSEVLVAP